MSKLSLLTKNEFKETTRYLQKQLSEELNQKIKLSTMQEAMSRSMGFNDYHEYQHFTDTMNTRPKEVVPANGDLKTEIQSLVYLLDVAQKSTSQSYKVRDILLHLYNELRWPINMAELRILNRDITTAVMNVFALYVRGPKAICSFVPNSEEIFHFWINQKLKNEAWNKHKRKFIQFLYLIESMIKIPTSEGFLEKAIQKGLEFYGFHDWKMKVNLNFDYTANGNYGVMVRLKDEDDYEYLIFLRFNVVDGLIFTCGESRLNEEHEEGLIASLLNKGLTEEDIDYGPSEDIRNHSLYYTKSKLAGLFDELL